MARSKAQLKAIFASLRGKSTLGKARQLRKGGVLTAERRYGKSLRLFPAARYIGLGDAPTILGLKKAAAGPYYSKRGKEKLFAARWGARVPGTTGMRKLGGGS